jgi:hypothetical protein
MTDHISLPWRMLCTYLHCYGPWCSSRFR